MSQDCNSDTLNTLKTEIKALQKSCLDTCSIIENAKPEFPSDQMVSGEEINRKVNSYVKSLEVVVQDSNTFISTDVNLLTSEFLIGMRQKINQIDELAAYTNGAILDKNAELKGLKHRISTVQESQSKPRNDKIEIQPEHIAKAKNKFKIMKNGVHDLIHSLCPRESQQIMDVLGDIISARLTNASDEYIQVSPEIYSYIEMLRDLNVVTLNPYNQFEVKLNY